MKLLKSAMKLLMKSVILFPKIRRNTKRIPLKASSQAIRIVWILTGMMQFVTIMPLIRPMADIRIINNGVDEDSFKDLIDEYIKLIKKELEIDEADFRQFGAADNSKAQEFYEKLVKDGSIPNNFWEIDTPIGEEESDGESV